jgi:Flp pilus assembly protein TadD
LSCALLTLLISLAGCSGVPQQKEKAAFLKPDTAPKASRSESVVERDGAYGFTMNEVVRIGSDVRRDYQQAVILLQTNQFSAGAALLETVVAQAPEVTIPHLDLGMAYVQLGELDKAETEFRTALALAPNHPVALNELGILLRRTGRFDAARDSYQKALAVHPGFHYALLNLGMLCDLFLEDLGCALESYSRYSEIVVDDPEVGIWIADVENRMRQTGGE